MANFNKELFLYLHKNAPLTWAIFNNSQNENNVVPKNLITNEMYQNTIYDSANKNEEHNQINYGEKKKKIIDIKDINSSSSDDNNDDNNDDDKNEIIDSDEDFNNNNNNYGQRPKVVVPVMIPRLNEHVYKDMKQEKLIDIVELNPIITADDYYVFWYTFILPLNWTQVDDKVQSVNVMVGTLGKLSADDVNKYRVIYLKLFNDLWNRFTTDDNNSFNMLNNKTDKMNALGHIIFSGKDFYDTMLESPTDYDYFILEKQFQKMDRYLPLSWQVEPKEKIMN